MAIIERYKSILDKGTITSEGVTIRLDAQLKYDYLAAIHTMEQLEGLFQEFQERNNKREQFKEKLLNSCRSTLRSLLNDENSLKEIKNIDHAIKILSDCRTEILKLEGAAHESRKLAKKIEDGVSAGR